MTLQVLKGLLGQTETPRGAWDAFWAWAEKRKRARAKKSKIGTLYGLDGYDPAWQVLRGELVRVRVLARLRGKGPT